MDVMAIIAAVSALGSAASSLRKVVDRVLSKGKAEDRDRDELVEGNERLRTSLQSVKVLAGILEEYNNLRLDMANITSLCNRLYDYVKQSKAELRKGEDSSACLTVDILLISVTDAKNAAFPRLLNKIEEGEVDSQDGGRLQQAIEIFNESYIQVVGFVDSQTLANLQGNLDNMCKRGAGMLEVLGKTSQKLINVLKKLQA